MWPLCPYVVLVLGDSTATEVVEFVMKYSEIALWLNLALGVLSDTGGAQPWRCQQDWGLQRLNSGSVKRREQEEVSAEQCSASCPACSQATVPKSCKRKPRESRRQWEACA